MEQGIFLCPFSKRASVTFLFSWMISFQEDQTVNITPDNLLVKAHQFGVHPTTLKRQIDALPHNKYFSLQKRGGGYTLSRSSLLAPYLSIYLKPSFLRQHTLSTSEVVLFSAILILQKKGKEALTRKALSGRTGFSLRQVCYCLQSLKKKGLLVSGNQREKYVRHTQEGRIEDTRDRRVYLIPLKHISKIDCKIAPLKELIKNPVINNGSLGRKSCNIQRKRSDFKVVWNFYKKNFHQHTFENFYGAIKLLKLKNISLPDSQVLLDVLQKAKEIPFLKVANKFGWQEAIIECYGRSGSIVSDASNHISKYKNHKPGFVWFVTHAQRILKGVYQPKDPSYKQRFWSTLFVAKKGLAVKTNYKPILRRKHDLEKDISSNITFSAEERELHLLLLRRAGEGLYAAWIKSCQYVTAKDGISMIKAPSKFVRDMVEQKILIPRGLSQEVLVEV